MSSTSKIKVRMAANENYGENLCIFFRNFAKFLLHFLERSTIFDPDIPSSPKCRNIQRVISENLCKKKIDSNRIFFFLYLLEIFYLLVYEEQITFIVTMELYLQGSRISGAANFNATLHCKDTDVIKLKHNPGTWVIEQITAQEDPSSVRVVRNYCFTQLSIFSH